MCVVCESFGVYACGVNVHAYAQTYCWEEKVFNIVSKSLVHEVKEGYKCCTLIFDQTRGECAHVILSCFTLEKIKQRKKRS